MVNEIIIIFLLLFLLIPIIICNSSIIIFDSRQYRAGHFAFKSNGDMIIEYSYNQYRLFYGLKSNGKYFFNNDKAIKEIEINNTNGNIQRYESNNIFVSINRKEYLFSISVSNSGVVELIDFSDTDNISCKVNSVSNFLGHYMFSYVFSLLKIDGQPSQFLISYISDIKNSIYDYGLSKFNFSNFGLENSDFTMSKKADPYQINFSNRIISCFIINTYIVIFLVNSDKSKYILCIYDPNFVTKSCNAWVDYISGDNYNGEKLFSRGYNLEDKDAIFIYFTKDNSNSLKLKTGTISDGFNSFEIKIEQLLNDNNYVCNFNIDVRMNDFVKIDSKRFAYIGISNDNPEMYIYLFDLYNDYKSMNIRIYKENFNNNELKPNLEIAAGVYNGHLIFTSTPKKMMEHYMQC